jgi:monothiol glutaredoxin
VSEPIHERIKRQVEAEPVVLYMKGTPVMPMCGFSAAVVQVLSQLGVRFQAHNVLDDPELRQGIKDFASWPTIPQLYVGGELVGGCDIVREMYQSGELASFLEERGVPVAAKA